ncbi:MAG: short-chain dehydrogenase/reductase [Tardiphaga sp.]|nr:short-chain dehydrogenase/reductase [Tardiphaga sp.]
MTRTWFITGASSGLGREMTEQLLSRGDKVVGAMRRVDALAELKERYADTLSTLRLDLVDLASIRAAVEATFANGRIDVVVSNAGYGLFGAAEEVSDSQIDRQIATNLTGPIHLIRAVLPHLRAQGGGRIVQVSSEGGQIAYPGFSLYHASKWGIEGFVEAVRQEVAPFGVDFIIVEPGPTATSFGAGIDRATPIGVYNATPAGEVRRAIASGAFEIKGDAQQAAAAMIVAATAPSPALRLALGSSAYEKISLALQARLEALHAQRDVALSADRS